MEGTEEAAAVGNGGGVGGEAEFDRISAVEQTLARARAARTRRQLGTVSGSVGNARVNVSHDMYSGNSCCFSCFISVESLSVRLWLFRSSVSLFPAGGCGVGRWACCRGRNQRAA
jgi:hypothetical protein